MGSLTLKDLLVARFTQCRAVLRRRGRRRANIAVFSLFIMVVLLGMVAFAIDTGYIVHTRTELQRTADAAAMAAAEDLPDDSGVAAVVQNYIALNHAAANSVQPTPQVEVGFWNDDTAAFTTPVPLDEFPNAVRVTVNRTQATGDPLRLFFAPLLGTSNADVSATSTAVLDRRLCGPIVGVDWIKVPGNPLTDSYRSSQGSYDPMTAGDEGTLCSNGTIDISGNAVINGSSIAGKDKTTDISGGAQVTGNLGNRISTLKLEPVDVTDVQFDNDNDDVPQATDSAGNPASFPLAGNCDFSLNANESVSLPPGTYYFKNLDLSTSSRVDISGKTVIYMTDELKMAASSSINNSTQNPSNLKILSTHNKAKLTADATFYGVLYAPNAEITVSGNADIFGAVVGKKLTIAGDSAIHYDEDLKFLPEIELPRTNHLVQ